MYSNVFNKQAIVKFEGDAIPGFPSIDAFIYLLQPLLENLKQPAFECLSRIHNLLEEKALEILNHILIKMPALESEIAESV